MKAAIIRRYGGPNVLELADVSDPEVGDRDILIEVHAASVNPVDFKIRAGQLRPLLPYRLPLVMGNDVAGRVIGLGRAARRFKLGDEVYARPPKDRIGTFAERIAIDESAVALKPCNLTMEEAASVPLVGLTSWQALVELGRVGQGQKVFIPAGSGGVGTFAVQLAKSMGAFVATTTSTANVSWVKGLGADLVIDYRKELFEDVLKGYDVVFATLGGRELERCFKIVRRGGRVISITDGADARFGKEWGVGPLLTMALAAMGYKVNRLARKAGAEYRYLFMKHDAGQLAKLGELIEAGRVKPVIDKAFPLDRIGEAMAYVESGRAKGKVVVTVRQ